jgi:predicted  nucleic acid-binding Zn-ribbon protein
MKKKTKDYLLNEINKIQNTVKEVEENNRKAEQSYRETSEFINQQQKELQEKMDKAAGESFFKKHKGKIGLTAAALLASGAGYVAYKHYKNKDRD